MGYNVQINKSSVVIPRSSLPQVLQIWKNINSPQFNHLKYGGTGWGDKKTAWWYSWMTEDYHATVESVEDVLDMLGFYYTITDQGGIRIDEYNSKTGQEDLFFVAIAHLLPDSKITWVGEDASIWDWEFTNGIMLNDGKYKDNPFISEVKQIESVDVVAKAMKTFYLA